MMNVPLTWYLALSALLFVIGMTGILLRRNLIVMFMCVEIMLSAANLSFIAFSRYYGDMTGHMFSFMVIAVAAAEAGIGLALIINVFRQGRGVEVDGLNLMKG